jgi:galactose oxidase
MNPTRSVYVVVSSIGRLALALVVMVASSLFDPQSLALAQTPATLALGATGLCADVTGRSVDPGAAVIAWACNGGTNQNWTPQRAGAGYNLISQNSGLCMDVSGGSTAAGAPIIQWNCEGNANQIYTLTPQGNGYALVASHSGLCVTAASTTAQGGQLKQQKCNGGATQTWQVNGLTVSALPSKWTAPITLPLVPAAAANLPNGTILVWSANYTNNFDGGEITPGKTYTAIFDPATQGSTRYLVSNTGHDMFCPGIANLPDGRIFVTGGSSSAKVSLYTQSTNAWASSNQMNIRRAYHGSVTLSNGSVFVIGGSWNGGLGGKTGETWTSGSGWRVNTGLPADPILTQDAEGIYRQDNHAWLFALAGGYVFHAGPSKAMHVFNTAGGGGPIGPVVNRANDDNAMNGSASLYDITNGIGKILAVGGARDYEQSNATSNATVITVNMGRGSVSSAVAITPMSYQRAFANSVVLPNGQVVVIGGQTFAQPFSDDTSILAPELWDPNTQKFSVLSSQAVPRVYHSWALLLPDGRVLSGGGGLCGGCGTDHPNVEILTPPYLLNANGSAAARPTISNAPADATLGTTIAVTASGDTTTFALMRLSSSTHSVNNEQRRIKVTPTVGTGGEFLLTIPSEPGYAVPGYYMLFALNAQGVPSVSKTLRLHQ